ncbi:hypothetical protein LGN43_02905 [Burkholderia multivorans]|nr:hypothetical protein [Burkholderia multivorans]
MSWYTYEVLPIDFGWEHLLTVEETLKKIAVNDAKTKLHQADPEAHVSVDYFLAAWESAQDVARDSGWDGDFRHDPVVFWVPTEGDFSFGFAFKQDNNGTTYVVSPCELPHLIDR